MGLGSDVKGPGLRKGGRRPGNRGLWLCQWLLGLWFGRGLPADSLPMTMAVGGQGLILIALTSEARLECRKDWRKFLAEGMVMSGLLMLMLRFVNDVVGIDGGGGSSWSGLRSHHFCSENFVKGERMPRGAFAPDKFMLSIVLVCSLPSEVHGQAFKGRPVGELALSAADSAPTVYELRWSTGGLLW
jgi:hypothetical protein